MQLRQLQERRDARLQLKYGSMTLGEWLTIWLAEYCDGLKAKTRESYAEAIRLYICPYPLWDVRLEELTSADIKQWLTLLRSKNSKRGNKPSNTKLAESTLAIPFRRVRTALEAARREKLIADNPAADVKPPSGARRRKPVVLDDDQLAALLTALQQHHLYPLYAVAILLGVRRGELLGLRWCDVDCEGRTIHIEGQLQLLKVHAEQPRQLVWVESPKTRAGDRWIDIPVELADVLNTWRSTQAEERALIGPSWRGKDYVFTSEEGGPLSPRNLLRGFKRLLKRVGLPETMTLHDLRHCAGSLMLERGENIEAVSELLGHSSRAVTERVYIHALRKHKRQAGESLGYLLRKDEGS